MWYKQYTSLCRIWIGHRLLICDMKPENLQIILSSSKILNKPTFFYKIVGHFLGNGLITAQADVWRKHKRVIAPAFSTRMMEEFVSIFNKYNMVLVDKLRPHINGCQFDISKYIRLTVLDSICETTCDINESTPRKVKSEFTETMLRVGEIIHMRIFKFWMHFDFIFKQTNLGSQSKQIIQDFTRLSDMVIAQKKKEYKLKKEKESEQHKATERKPKVLIDILLEQNESGSSFSDAELRDEVITMITAGYDTTVQTIGFCVLMLAMHQDIQEKVYEEIFRIFGDSDCEVTKEDLKQMTYTEMVLKETLRLFPAAPFFGREAKEDFELPDHKVPAGSTIVIAPILLHRNPEVYLNPEQFNPENFTPERIAERHRYSYIPFSAGPRSCIGQAYAMLAVKTTIANLIRNYKFFTDIKMDDIKLVCDAVLRCSIGYPVKLVARK